MKAYLGYLNHIEQTIEEKFSKSEKPVNWYHPYRSASLEEQRNELLERIGDSVHWDFKHTKPWINSISKGCRLCGQGEWSCLFVTGKCNANCFYCPAVQDKDETPQTQKLLFSDPNTYAEYINQFGFQGVSFSGGEPLLFFDRTLDFIKTVRKACDPSIYMWMYTNGILISDEKLQMLADAGLNEIRFDLGAVNYNSNVLKNAARFLPNVTVEIPAVPEEGKRLMELLPQLCEYGVTNLNLHQLRLTKYNSSKLLERDYTFLHGEQPTIAESELTALGVIDFVRENHLPIGINYCNFQFKNRFQKAGFRSKMANVLLKEGEEITENGFIRRIEAEENGTNRMVSFGELKSNRLFIPRINVSYYGRVLENLHSQSEAQSYSIAGEDFPVIEGIVAQPVVLSGAEIDSFIEMISASGTDIPEHPILFEVWKQEFIEEGMRDFF
ncbi:MAG TPA: radical SAM protein [Prolixibacteraceae bacterium]|nr:radical SAM protein [Prolixibacteraceae bacterium]